MIKGFIEVTYQDNQKRMINVNYVEEVFDNKNPFDGRCIAIGHFIKDEFILIDDLVKLEK